MRDTRIVGTCIDPQTGAIYSPWAGKATPKPRRAGRVRLVSRDIARRHRLNIREYNAERGGFCTRIHGIRALRRMVSRARVIGLRTKVVAALIRQMSPLAYTPRNINRESDYELSGAFDHSRPLYNKAMKAAGDYLGKRIFNTVS